MNIGIYTYWGLPRNSVMYMKSIVELLNKEHKVFIWNVGNNDITDEFKNIDATIHPKDEKGGFQQWLTDNKIEVCIFNTYNIYEQDGDKVDLCDKLKIKTIGYVPYDSLDKNKEHYNLFLSPSLNYKRKALQQRIFNQIILPYTVNLEEYNIKPMGKEDETIVYLHLKGIDPLGSGDTKFLEKHWNDIRYADEELLIIDKEYYLMNRYDLIRYMKTSDCLILPFNKRNEICATIIEAFACGKPVITNDIEPINDFVKQNTNGFLIKETKDVDKKREYRKIMDMLRQNMILKIVSQNAHKTAQEFDNTKFIETVKELLK